MSSKATEEDEDFTQSSTYKNDQLANLLNDTEGVLDHIIP